MIERQKAAKLQAASAGKYRGGRRPFGFESNGVTVAPGAAAAVLDASQRVPEGSLLFGTHRLGRRARGWSCHRLVSIVAE